MLGRNGRVVAAVGGLILAIGLAGCVHGQPNSRDPQAATDAQKATAAPGSQTPILKVEAKPQEDSCEHPKAGEDQTLCYARRSAEAAEEQATWSRRQGWLTGWQTFGLAITIALTLLGLNLARRALNSVERAFVYTEGPEQDFIDGKLRVKLRWKNSGSTPAMAVLMRLNHRTGPDPLPPDFDFPDFDADGNRCSKTHEATVVYIGPNAAQLSDAIIVSLPVLRAVAAGQSRVYVWGWVEYTDVLSNRRRRTEHCSSLRVISWEEKTQGEFTANMFWEHYHEHNGSDEYCLKRPDPPPPRRQLRTAFS